VSSDACNVPSAWALLAPARPLLQVAGVGPAEYLLPLVGGFAGSMHCVGMCGGFAVAMGAGPGRRRRSVLYNAGRLGTLLGLGALAGTAGAVAVGGGPAGSSATASTTGTGRTAAMPVDDERQPSAVPAGCRLPHRWRRRWPPR